jgi:putative CocE/NonD family hydrolase
MPNYSTITVERNVAVPMRDGVNLSADIFRPAGDGPFPTLMQRTPYDKSTMNLGQLMLRAVDRGYAVVVQDVRGRFASDGEFDAFVNERNDGYDMLEWLSNQSWCDGNVGMYSQSYVGLTQWQAAMSGHPALKAIVPTVTADNYHDGWVYQGGAFELSFNLSWVWSNLAANTILRRKNDDPTAAYDYEQLVQMIDGMTEELNKLPLKHSELISRYAPYYNDWVDHPSYDDFWAALDVSLGHDRLTVPAMNVGGWHDIFLKGTIGNFTGRRANAPTDEVRARQRLVIGPWNHSGMRTGNPIGSVDFGVHSTGADVDIDGLHLRWYDRWLRGIENGVDDDPPIRLFVMGARRWRTAQEWPLPETDWQEWYFHSAGSANSLHGNGGLSLQAPTVEPTDSFVYNPLNPVPTMGGGLCCNAVFSQGGSYDQRSVEAREDVLVYTSPPLEQELEVTGPLKVILHASSSATDTDFTAKLVDVHPCGMARNLNDGILRARYRNSMSEPELLTPGEITEFEIDLVATSNAFLPGHRIRVEISSSNFPRFDRNPNTGEQPGRSDRVVSALQTIHHSAQHPSRIILPVIPAK